MNLIPSPPLVPDEAWCACFGDDATECAAHRESDADACRCPCHDDSPDSVGLGI